MNSKQAKKLRSLAHDVMQTHSEVSASTEYRIHNRSGAISVDRKCLRGVYLSLKLEGLTPPLSLSEFHRVRNHLPIGERHAS